ncbi:VWA domain-containing protein [Amycolatopsis sp. NPDC059090]|uniref:VWA domain-containing protein n=1 Tax=unclassified Amycolatopsis TaxID=2618356 RepID=UPI003670BB46
MSRGWDVEVHQNRYLGEGDTEMQAVVTVSARNDGQPEFRPPGAEVLLVDCSTSMRYPPTKIAAARRAAAAAIRALPDGVGFAVVRGTERADLAYPLQPGLAVASDETRAAAVAAVERFVAVGGTAMGTWLECARTLFASAPDAVRHAILLTDGNNQSQSAESLRRELDACEGQFVCDARGIGDGWQRAELVEIGRVLRGSVDSVVRDEDLVDDFRALMAAALAKVIPSARLRIGVTEQTTLRFVKQVWPSEYDLTSRCVPDGDGKAVLSLGSWSAGETREFQLAVEVSADTPEYGFDRMLAWVEVDGAADSAVPLLAHWTHDPVAPTLVDPKVRRYTMHAELSEALVNADEAYAAGDHARAAREWGQAVEIATRTNNKEVLRRLARVVDTTGETVQLRPEVTRSELLNLLVSTVSNVGDEPRDARPAPPPDTKPAICPHCQNPNPSGARFCEECGETLAGGAA